MGESLGGVGLDLDGVCRVKAALLGCFLLEAILVIGVAEVSFEAGPGFVGGVLAIPFLAVIEEESGVEDEAQGGGEELGGGEGLTASVGVLLGVVELLQEGLEWGGRIPGGFHSIFVVE